MHVTQHSEQDMPEQGENEWRPSIRSYLILMNLILLCLLFPAVSIFFLHETAEFRDAQLSRTVNQMRKGLESRSASLVRSMALSASQAMAGYDFTFLNILVDQVVGNDPEILYCLIMSPGQKAMVHSAPEKLGSVLDGKIDQKVAAGMGVDFPSTLPEEQRVDLIRFMDGEYASQSGSEPIMEAIAPVYNGAQFSGVLRCGYSLKKLNGEILAAQQEWADKMQQFEIYLATITALFFSIGVLVAGLFTRSLVRSTRLLSDGVYCVSEGNLEHEIQQKGLVCDEFMRLSTAFNAMTVQLRTSYQQLDEYSRSLEQKVAERTRELEEAQAILMQQAHEAGMAEMAVGILHNIGNAITPAKVGAALLTRRIARSPLRSHLDEIMSQISRVVAEASTSTVSGPEKERLLSIIRLLPESIQEEYDKIAEDIQRIREKHEHIESIIHLQMRYARLFGDHEEVDINQLTRDAVRMLDESLRKRTVDVVMDFSKVPLVRIEQAKLIQIVVNMIKNAYEAMDEAKPEERHLMISTSYEKGPLSYVALSIRDTGTGFSPEEKEKLFVFGYTTKVKGSGFGLHSCANYLIANNGSISAHSEGKGRGAEFVVRLAVAAGREETET